MMSTGRLYSGYCTSAVLLVLRNGRLYWYGCTKYCVLLLSYWYWQTEE